ncbi:MAG: DUF1501 domain-containing protein, partial [bacterium]|nr:DUF1501 domain-containing protein [bacterium]
MFAEQASAGPQRPSRRLWLQNCSSGFGLVALSSLFQRMAFASGKPRWQRFEAKAKSVILCYLSGGISHVDSFDPKPKLEQLHGQPMPVSVARTQFNQNGRVFASPFRFQPCGQSGLEISEIFPHISQCADRLAVVRSMTTSVNEHAQGNFALHTGFPFLGHPSAGAWISYGLGSANDNLPTYVVLQSGGAVAPHGGVGLFGNGYLPGQHQASILQADQEPPIENIQAGLPADLQSSQLRLIRQFDEHYARETGDPQVEAAIQNYETAFRMQSSIPDLCDLSQESHATRRLYGLDDPHPTKAAYARQALLARRMVEQGVRFVELSCLTENIGAGGAPNPWDQHGDLEKGHRAMAYQVDQPIAALIKDLEARGMLDETLIVFTGEFGRTPFSQGTNGRDHNPFGFSLWLAGGGVRGGSVLGATDELG